MLQTNLFPSSMFTLLVKSDIFMLNASLPLLLLSTHCPVSQISGIAEAVNGLVGLITFDGLHIPDYYNYFGYMPESPSGQYSLFHLINIMPYLLCGTTALEDLDRPLMIFFV